ncbi:hypothetical protein [Nonomuraea typhae]|uniref:hypothetical protein n=1 Tax=Nonomuraea typhae TaxID=2603600 RepID=UPI0012FB67BA|nr:hypothetical protein [Nonomuraea typhae]
MTTDGDGERRALVCALVAEFAPEELPAFDLLTSACFAAPGKAGGARVSGAGLADPTLTGLLWGVMGGLTTEMTLAGVRPGRTRWRQERQRRKAGGPDAPLPALGDAFPEAEAVITDHLRSAGREDAEAIAHRATDRWARRDWTTPQ